MKRQDKQHKEFQQTTSRGSRRGRQGKKDSGSKRVNFDNERESKFDKAYKSEYDNAVEWYKKDPQLAEAAARLGFSHTTGLPYLFDSHAYFTPGVLGIYFVSALGSIQAVNQAKDSTYSYTVHANSRNTIYTAADQFMFIFAGKEVFSAIAMGIRAYGVLRKYEQTNAYTPDALLLAMGFNPEDLRSNYSHMLFDLNQLIAQSRQIWIPNTMPVIEREFWMNSHIYMDGESEKSQYYLYAQEQFYTISETGSTQGTMLTPASGWNLNTVRNTGYTWNEYTTFVQTLIQNLVDSEDRGVIFGDILKAYGADRIYTINDVTLDYTVQAVYDKEVLEQMSNATIAYSSKIPNITQNISTQQIAYNSEGLASGVSAYTLFPTKALLNYHGKDQPSSDWVLVASRMTSIGNGVVASGENFVVTPLQTGTEYAVRMCIYYFTTTGGAVSTKNIFSNVDTTISNTDLANYSVFDWAPTLYVVDSTLPTTANPSLRPVVQTVFSDLENAILVDNTEVQRLHNACVYSEWGLPISLS